MNTKITTLSVVAGLALVAAMAAPLMASAQSVPTITSISPSSELNGSGSATMTIMGTAFMPSSTVNFNGATINSSYISPTELTVILPAADFTTNGAYSVSVNNAGYGSSNTATFTVYSNTAPTVTGVSPSLVTTGSTNTMITVTGSGFVTGSMVNFDGAMVATTYVSPNELTATVPAAFFVSSGPNPVTVTNPGIGTSASSAMVTVSGTTPTLPDTGSGPQGFSMAAFLLAIAAAAGSTWLAMKSRVLFAKK